MAPYHPPSGGRRNKLRLDFNENTVGASPHGIDFIKRYLTASDLSIYPEYENALQDLARHFGVQQTEMTLTNGTDEAIQLLINTYVDDDAEVMVLRPSYAMYRFYSQLAGAKVEELDYRAGKLAFPLEELLESITPQTRAILISNPNNPTGTGIAASGLEKILRKAPQAAVLVDEAYYEFCGVTMLGRLRDHANLFVSRTFSKVYGMAAMRIGAVLSQPANIAHLHKAQSPYSVNMLAAMAAAEAADDQEYIRATVEEVLESRAKLCAGLQRLGIEYVPSVANFVLVYAGQRASQIRDALLDRAILVRDRSYEIPGAVRITVGTRAQTTRILTELERIW